MMCMGNMYGSVIIVNGTGTKQILFLLQLGVIRIALIVLFAEHRLIQVQCGKTRKTARKDEGENKHEISWKTERKR